VTVFLVGAGPGDPGLLTIRGAEVLARADVVVHDRLAEPSVLDLAPPAAVRVDVGERPGGSGHQAEINALLVEHGLAGLEVVRLKGGDPFVFGSGVEEAEALAAAGVPFEVVPGVTSAVAVPAYAGIPVTHRGMASSFTVVTGDSRHGVDTETDWEALAAAGGTIVVLTGVAHRAEIAGRLRRGGLASDTPVAAVHRGTRPRQHTVRTTLGGLGAVTLDPTVTLVIGAVAGLDLAWFESRPLFGRRVVVTRARAQAPDLIRRLRELGAETVELPVIDVVDPADGGVALRAATRRLSAYDWVVFTSTNAVARVLATVPDARSFGSARIAAVGRGTAEALANHRLVADLVPGRFVAEGLLAAFPPPGPGGGRVLVPRAAVARDVLPDGLRSAGWQVDVVDAYRTVPVQPSEAGLEGVRSADAITFTSSSTVTNFVVAAGPAATPPVVVCLGPVTARTAVEAGLAVDAVAATGTIDALTDAVVRALADRPEATSR